MGHCRPARPPVPPPPPPNGPPIASWAASPLPYPTAAELRRCPPPVTRVVHLGRFHRCRTGTFSFCYVSTSAHYLGGMMARPLHRLQVAVHCRPHTARLCGPLPDSACLYTLCVWRPPASLMSRCQAVWAVVRTPDWVAALRSWNSSPLTLVSPARFLALCMTPPPSTTPRIRNSHVGVGDSPAPTSPGRCVRPRTPDHRINWAHYWGRLP